VRTPPSVCYKGTIMWRLTVVMMAASPAAPRDTIAGKRMIGMPQDGDLGRTPALRSSQSYLGGVHRVPFLSQNHRPSPSSRCERSASWSRNGGSEPCSPKTACPPFAVVDASGMITTNH